MTTLRLFYSWSPQPPRSAPSGRASRPVLPSRRTGGFVRRASAAGRPLLSYLAVCLRRCRLDHPAHHLGLIEGRDRPHGFLGRHSFTHTPLVLGMGTSTGPTSCGGFGSQIPQRVQRMQVMPVNKRFLTSIAYAPCQAKSEKSAIYKHYLHVKRAARSGA